MKQAHRQSGPGKAYEGLTELGPNGPRWNGQVRIVPELLEEPLSWRKPQRIFVNSMSDLFHELVPDAFIGCVFDIMQRCPQHTFQILTKRPLRMANLSLLKLVVLPNVWLGVSVENQATADERIPILLRTPAAVRFVSYEPALGPVDFGKWIPGPVMVSGAKNPMPAETAQALSKMVNAALKHIGLHFLDWIIVGGESGPRARPAHPDWFRSVRNQCQAAAVPFFFKQWGEWTPQSLEGRADLESTHHLCPCGACFAKGEEAVGQEHVGSSTHHKGVWYAIRKVGKKAAGRLLDGRELSEFPEVQP